MQPSSRSRIVHHRLLDVSQTTGTGVSSTSPSTPVDDGPAEAATPAVPSQPAVELLVVGAAAGLDALADHLPGSWRVRQVPAGSTGADVDIVLLVGEGVDAVRYGSGIPAPSSSPPSPRTRRLALSSAFCRPARQRACESAASTTQLFWSPLTCGCAAATAPAAGQPGSRVTQ